MEGVRRKREEVKENREIETEERIMKGTIG